MATFTVKRGFISGFGISRNATNPAYKIDVQAGECADSDAKYQIKTDAVVTIDITQSGANGLDTGSESASTWYAVFVIDDSSKANSPAGLLSESESSPTLPSGYDIFRRVGWVWNNASSDFRKFEQIGDGNVRQYFHDLTPSLRRILTNGNATNWTTVDGSELIAPTSIIPRFQLGFETGASGSASDELFVRPKGFTNAVTRIRAGVVSTEKLSVWGTCPTNDDQEIEYKVSNSNNAAMIAVIGYEDSI